MLVSSTPDLKLKDVSKALGKAFACGASVSDTASGGKEIVIQGDVLDTLPGLLVDTYKVRGMLGSAGSLRRAFLDAWLIS